MSLTGKSYIAGEWLGDATQGVYQAWAPEENEMLAQDFFQVNETQINQACQSAGDDFFAYAQTSRDQRATFLETIAEQILALGDELISTTMAETGLPKARLEGECGRTVNQLNMFARLLRDEDRRVVVEAGDNEREPLPKPATELHYLAVGPVAVFGASNFPYAFSTLGGDTASALAAGCPVVVKGHPAHPATGELMARAISKAIEITGMPKGVFSLLQSSTREPSHSLVKHPAIKAVGFTGSLNVASALQTSIQTRDELIPLYGELGSINPQFVLPELMAQNPQGLATQFVQSLMMGQGQFCTSPGVWFVPNNEAFIEQVKYSLAEQASGPLLTRSIVRSYLEAITSYTQMADLNLVGNNTLTKPHHAHAHIFQTDIASFKANKAVHEEVFGPCAVIVTYDDVNELVELASKLEGQLTASIHGSAAELSDYQSLSDVLAYRVGRLIYNQMPTGVEVCHSMNHGGPFPSSTDVRTTSVGAEAFQRFVRPICYQNRTS